MTEAIVEVETAPPYRVVVGPGVLDRVSVDGAVAVLTDENVEPLYAARLTSLAGAARLVVAPGEDAKSFAVLETVLDFLVAANLDRASTLVTLGGGVVGDLGGLAASLFMRGIDVVQCPTTLLAMVDASVGGKTAVNLAAGKNLAGTFHQPRAVYADTATLATLPADEYLSGLGEVVKTALIGDAELLTLLEDEAERIAIRDPELLIDVVARCVRVKAGVVARDEREGGERKTLNLGHTFAHGIEHAAGYGTIPHGVAVAVGLGLALEAGARTGMLEDETLPLRVAALHERLGLPASLADLRERASLPFAAADLLAGMRHDKKGRGGTPTFVVPRGAERIEWDVEVPDDVLHTLLA